LASVFLSDSVGRMLSSSGSVLLQWIATLSKMIGGP
jgi:hypothetical protein